MIITIDGSAGTGKSTVARAVAKRLGFTFFDTGAIYRTLSWWILDQKIDPLDQEAVVKALPNFQYEIRGEGKDRRYFANGIDVSEVIRTPSISMAASQIATYPEVRQAMVKIQRSYGEKSNVVFEGRDMGTIVFPSADLKIFLTAEPEVRAERRFKELCQKFPDLKITQEELLKEMQERDVIDSTRKVSPLKKADDAILIDTSFLTVEQVIAKIIELKSKLEK